jgi:hypothetical protein
MCWKTLDLPLERSESGTLEKCSAFQKSRHFDPFPSMLMGKPGFSSITGFRVISMIKRPTDNDSPEITREWTIENGRDGN